MQRASSWESTAHMLASTRSNCFVRENEGKKRRATIQVTRGGDEETL